MKALAICALIGSGFMAAHLMGTGPALGAIMLVFSFNFWMRLQS